MNVSVTSIASGSTKMSSALSIVNPSTGILIASSSLITSIAILFTNEYISKCKIRYTESRNWINVISLLYLKTLKQPMVDKKIDGKEAKQTQKFQNHYFDKRNDTKKETQFKVEEVCGIFLG